MLLAAFTVVACKKNTIADSPAPEKKWVVRTIAGDGTRDFREGAVSAARFAFPADVAVGANGTIYVTDILNARIRKIAGGNVSTLAGDGTFDIVNGDGPSARFINPFSLTIGPSENLYTSDENDPRIRRTTPGSTVSVYAGIEASGLVNGDRDTARFGLGNYLAADANGNLYVSDVRNNCIRKINAEGKVTMLAGTGILGFNEGNGSQAQFNYPGGIAIDEHGNVYVADRGNYRIRKITPDGMVSTLSGIGTTGATDGAAGVAQFTIDMHDMVVDSKGNLYVADESRIRKISPDGFVSTIAGSEPGYADGVGPAAKFDYINGLGIDTHDKIYAADLNNNRIREISFE